MSLSMDTTATATPLIASSAGSMNILSDKVQRALQVRTDTPAMKAALEALGQLDNNGIVGGVDITAANGKQQASHNNNTPSSSSHSLPVAVTSLDARSVRHAIEYDALQQALHLQQNLSSLVTTIRELRQGISDCAALASHVKHAISMNVVTETTRTSMISTTTAASAAATTTSDGSSGDVALLTTMSSSDQQQYQQQQQQQAEEKLATTIAEAFQRRNVARHRLEAVTQFLETFDLSEKDSRLLDHYNFEDMMPMHHHHNSAAGGDNNNSLTTVSAAAVPNGMAFLRALERVWQIRRALVKTFGSSGSANNNNFMMDSNSFDTGVTAGGGGEKSGGGLGASSALRMMESLAQKQEHAYERLYHWLQSYLQLLGKTSSTLTASEQQQQQYYDYGLMQLDQSLQHPFVQHALYTLRHVHAFYHHTVELLAGRRRQEETRLFLLALTTGIPQEQQPPLERLAHDPTQYVGEMLAHAFRALSSEADVALTVIHYKPNRNKKQNSKATASATGSNVVGGDASANVQEGGVEQHGGNDGMDDDEDDDDDDDQNENDLDGSSDLDYNNNTMSSFSGGTTTLKDKNMTATQMLSMTMSGMSRPLHARVQQVIASLARRPNNNNRNNSTGISRNHASGGDFQDGSVLEEVDSDNNMMMLGDDDDIMFEDEGAIVRNKLTHLYEICGLLLFYISAMNKMVGKLQDADIKRIKRRLLKKKAKTASRLVYDENQETNNDVDDILETSAVMDQQEANALVVCLMECLKEATISYEASIRVYCAMLNQLSATTGESQPNLVLAMMLRIAECHMSSPGFAQDVAGTNQACQMILSIEWVTETLVQAALMCCSSLDDTAAIKQAVATSKKADIDVIVAEKLDEQIEAMEASLINKLVEMESANVLDLCGLGSLVAAWQRWKQRLVATSSALTGAAGGDEDDDNNTAATLMASYPGLSAKDVEASMKDFLASLYSPPLPSLESAIKDPLIRKRARVKITENVCQTYAEIYADITSISKGGYEDVSFLGHTPDQVKRLFSA